MQRNIAILCGIVVLLLINTLIIQKERHLSNGTPVLLELAPVDPRSLMQGDYMNLRFSITDKISKELSQEYGHIPAFYDGFVIVSRDSKNIGSFVRISETQNHNNGELALQYRIRKNQIRFATNAFFFQEGDAKIFEEAKNMKM